MIRRTLLLAFVLGLVAPQAGCLRNLAELDMSDAGIRARVQSELAAHPELNVSYMQVNVHVRVVYLSGIVSTNEEKADIAQVVRKVPGVRHVVVNLLVQD